MRKIRNATAWRWVKPEQAGSGAFGVWVMGGDSGGHAMEPPNPCRSRHRLRPWRPSSSPRGRRRALALLAETASPGPFAGVTHSPVDLLHRGSPSRCSLSGSASVAMRCSSRPGVTQSVVPAPAGSASIGAGKRPGGRRSTWPPRSERGARGNFGSPHGNEDFVAFRSQLTSTRLQRDAVRGGYPPSCPARVNIDMMHSLAVPACPGSAQHRAALLFPF
jgi:hypothetical protein